MRERINRLAKGIVDTENPILDIQPLQIEETVRTGEIIRKELYIDSGNGLHLKGLIYSSNSRVTIANPAFGGLRNHIAYEVNSTCLEYGDEIKGSFYLVTNGGEREIPYSFRIEISSCGKLLGNLETAQDFAKAAKEDYNLALQIFEYEDFVKVPFMQDLRIRAMYDGIHGHGNRYAQMEQFLTGLGLKEPVQLVVSREPRVYECDGDVIEDQVELQKEGWGYLPIMVRVDGDFLILSEKTLSGEELHGNSSFHYQIKPARLHAGKNYGSITFESLNGSATVPILVISRQKGEVPERMKIRYGRYLALRLDYESGMQEPARLMSQMLEETDQLQMAGGSDPLCKLVTAELYTLAGKENQAEQLLEEIQEVVQENRQKEPFLYCLLQYVDLKLHPREEKKASLIRLLKNYLDEEKNFEMIYLLEQLDETIPDNPGEWSVQLKECYRQGCHSPFLYLKAVQLWEKMPQLLYGMGSFEIHALSFGAKRGLVSRELAEKIAGFALTARFYDHLYSNMLQILYQTYPQKKLLEAVCSMLIQGDRHGNEDFSWYDKALKEKLSLTRLYEYYLYSLPENFQQGIPREVLLYFSYSHDLDVHSRLVLYDNVLRYLDTETRLYQEYEREIEKFAIQQLLAGRIDSRLAVIYDRMIYKDMIDLPVARVLPGILKSYRISCSRKDMKYVVVCYEELQEEGIYPLVDGTAYVPLFSRQNLILFQDLYGNRYANVSFTKISVMDKPELEKRCFEIYAEHPMLLLEACRAGAEKENMEKKDAEVLEQALSELNLHPLYKKNITARLISYYQQQLESEDISEHDISYFLTQDKETLSGEQRARVCETLISYGYIREAYQMIQEYGSQFIRNKWLLKLCTRMILENLFYEDELLLHLSWQVFLAGMSDSVILDYLCEYFNGTSDQMYQILKQSIREHVETYDMEERLLAQMLFSGCTRDMDQVFAHYMTKKTTSKVVIKAYFTMKCSEYVLYGMPAEDAVFSYLEEVVCGAEEKRRLSTIYLLALTRYYSTLPRLEEEQKKLCREMAEILLEEEMVFPYFKKLAAHIPMLDQVMDKGIIQYVGQKSSRIELQVRILPDEEQYHRDEMKRVYQGIFIHQKVLFEGETMDYRIYEWKDQEKVLVQEGQIVGGPENVRNGYSRFGCLNQMALCLKLEDEEGLEKTMKEYVEKTAVVEGLYEIMQ